MDFRTVRLRATLLGVALLLSVAAVELLYVAYTGLTDGDFPEEPPKYLWDETIPELYRHNPAHSEIDSLGLRNCTGGMDDAGRSDVKVLFLGDSVAFGHGVDCESAFPFLVGEKMSQSYSVDARSYNAGVSGYNTFNEVMAYQRYSSVLRPEIVVLVTCLNDFVDPRLHWGDEGRNEVNIPDAAIPNTEYDNDIGVPTFGRWKTEARLRRFVTYRALARLKSIGGGRDPHVDADGFPVGVTGEVFFPITRLTHGRPMEFDWYQELLALLRDQVIDDGGELLIVLVPLGFQLTPEYPYYPQEQLGDIYEELGLDYIDLLSEFRRAGRDSLYLGTHEGFDDIWHLSSRGHERVADILVESFVRKGYFANGLRD